MALLLRLAAFSCLLSFGRLLRRLLSLPLWQLQLGILYLPRPRRRAPSRPPALGARILLHRLPRLLLHTVAHLSHPLEATLSHLLGLQRLCLRPLYSRGFSVIINCSLRLLLQPFGLLLELLQPTLNISDLTRS